MNPVTIQFAVGRNKTARVVRNHFHCVLQQQKQFTGHRSRIVVDFSTRKTVPRTQYVGLIRVADIKGLYICDLCESNIAFNPNVKKQIERSRATSTGA